MTAVLAVPLAAQPVLDDTPFAQQVALRVPTVGAGPNGAGTGPTAATAVAVTGDVVHAIARGAVWRYADNAWQPVRGLPAGARHLARAGDETVAAGETWVARLTNVGAETIPLPTGAGVAGLLPGPRLRVLSRTHLLTRDGTDWESMAIPPGTVAGAQSPQGHLAVIADGELHESADGATWVRVALRNADEGWHPPGLSHVAYDTAGQLWFAWTQGLGVRASSWRFIDGARGLPVLGVTGLAAGPDGEMWVATSRGAMRVHAGGIEYRQGRRWLPDDSLAAVDVTSDGHAWFASAAGVGAIQRRTTTLSTKAVAYEAAIAKHHRRTPFGYIVEARLSRPGDVTTAVTEDNDNDGLWTGMYGAAQCFAYAATGSDAARTRARRAFEALRMLTAVTQGGTHGAPPGFPARSIMPTSGPDPNQRDNAARDRTRKATVDARWKVLEPRWPRSADGAWYWKTDTSSDELDGHYYFYALYHDLVAQTEAEQAEVAAVVRAITDHLLAHDYTLTDHDGTPTRWAVFGPSALNHDRLWFEERGLNSLSMLTYLRIAHHVTGDAKYDAAARDLVETHGYAMNLLHPKVTLGVGGGNQSDDEMAFMNYYHLLKYERDPEVRQAVARSLYDYWQLERPERNPWFNLIAAVSLEDTTFTDAFGEQSLTLPREQWLDDTLDTLRRFPLDLVDWGQSNSHRLDVQPLPAHIRPDPARPVGLGLDGKVLPVDERTVIHWNVDPYQLDYPGTGLRLADGTSFLLPYYMALYHRVVLAR
jgi:hypothetical protein